ncbi:MAG: endolytic transglycosylase MltG [Treponema sp.]|nr:endolytic transglycosylase MltG [Treponema sp.]
MKKKKSRLIIRISVFLAVLVGVLLLLAVSSLGLIIYLNAPPQALEFTGYDLDGIRSSDGKEYLIEVRNGESANSVGLRLQRAGLIRSNLYWYWLCRFEKEYIKSGTYLLEIPASQMEIHRLLVSGKQILLRVTIPEGTTLKKTAKILEDNNICPAQDFLTAANDPDTIAYYRIPNASMEGYLFPDTYLFPENYPAVRVLRSMADNFFQRITEINNSALDMDPHELNRFVIIASIIEREYRVSDEAPVMAGVFYNRLRIGMALQSCATVEYIITEIQGRPHPQVLYNVDLEIRNPYNTYILPGLPPGPISSPGAVALNAVFNPEQNDYLYFRLTNIVSGRHYFSQTLDEHIRAGQLLLKSQP